MRLPGEFRCYAVLLAPKSFYDAPCPLLGWCGRLSLNNDIVKMDVCAVVNNLESYSSGRIVDQTL